MSYKNHYELLSKTISYNNKSFSVNKMKNKKLLLLLTFLIAILLIVSGIIGALLRLISIPSLIIALILLMGLGIQGKIPWWSELLKSRKNRGSEFNQSSTIIKNKKQAANKSLQSIDGLLNLINKDIKSEALRQEKERVTEELRRGDLIVVVFGTGSSGKTSLIRALLNEIIGEVGAPMGSTTANTSYRLKLKGIQRGIQIVDTPGILEAGVAGKEREKKALIKAIKADLMIIVVDGDLRSEEFIAIKSLGKAGKRILVALNKIDLRGEKEEQKLLEILRMRCKGLTRPEDIVSTTASPQSIPFPGRRPHQPPPEIGKLVERLARVLHEEGDELLADNVLLQCRNLDNAGRQLLNNQRLKGARNCIDRYCWISSGVIIATPLPVIDLIGAAAVNTQMVVEIAKVYGVEINSSRAKELALSVGKTLTGLGIVKGSVNLIGAALTLNLPTALISRVIQGVAAGWLTRVAGASFITYFKQNQNWGDGGVQEVVQRHYKLNQKEETLKNFLDNAVRRIVEPIKESNLKKLAPHRRPQQEGEAFDP